MKARLTEATIVEVMTDLINQKYYSTVDEAQGKLDRYFAMNRISDEDYQALMVLAKETYEPDTVTA